MQLEEEREVEAVFHFEERHLQHFFSIGIHTFVHSSCYDSTEASIMSIIHILGQTGCHSTNQVLSLPSQAKRAKAATKKNRLNGKSGERRQIFTLGFWNIPFSTDVSAVTVRSRGSAIWSCLLKWEGNSSWKDSLISNGISTTTNQVSQPFLGTPLFNFCVGVEKGKLLAH